MDIQTKQPGDVLDFDVDFSLWLPDEDSIANTPVVMIEPAGELTADAVQVASPIIKVWLSGGVDKATYKVTVRASTAGGRVKEKEFKLRVKEL